MAINLKDLHKGRATAPPRIVVFGPHGIGKSTFASQAPKPVFIPTEDGLGSIDTTAFPLARSYQDVLDAISVLFRESHEYETVVLDSLDWLEALVWQHVAKEAGLKSIEDFGYGKGYVYATDHFREVLAGLSALRDQRGMAVVLTAHCQVRRFDDPATEPYDRYTLKLHTKTAGLVQEWADIVGFASQEMVVKKEDVGFNKKVARGVVVGGHVLHLHRTPAYDAKARFDLPSTLPLSWAVLEKALSDSMRPEPPTNSFKKGNQDA